MEYYFIGVLVILFLLSIMDLTVGVANDAVNFLNSGYGSRSLTFKWLLVVASAGVFIGALFAGGMMDVARSGVFHPQYFMFEEVIMIYLAVMLNDVLLIDFFNTLGLPTSTTVSLVAALLGASFSFAVAKLIENGQAFTDIDMYMNTEKAFAMIIAIFVSIAVAFFFGLLIQKIARTVFSFNFSRYKIGGAIFGGLAIALISYFIFFKGMKSASFIDKPMKEYVSANLLMILSFITAGTAALLLILQYLFRVNVFRVIVIYGTFAIAMAFAGNDLVNFLGPSLAGLDAYNAYAATGDPSMTMESLSAPAKVPVGFLMGAGFIMLLTLWFNKKTRTVIRTEVGLARQNEGVENFDTNPVARSLVKLALAIGNFFTLVRIPAVHRWIEKRFTAPPMSNNPDAPAFDMVRAAVNLTVGSSLIAFGTSLKLPLSTTYVTFMVAMGTSLADRAWDRDSAVYRVSGVTTVIGGWFITAFLAFLSAALLAYVLYLGSIVAVILLSALTVFVLIRSKVIHRRREKEYQEKENLLRIDENTEENEILDMCRNNVSYVIEKIPEVVTLIREGLEEEKLKKLKEADEIVKDINSRTELFSSTIGASISALGDNYVLYGEYYLKNAEILREIAVSLGYLTHPVYNHINNQHKNLGKNQMRDFESLAEDLQQLCDFSKKIILENCGRGLADDLHQKSNVVCDKIKIVRRAQIERVKRKENASRSSLLFFNITTEIQNITRFVNELTELDIRTKSQVAETDYRLID
ncbi:MAG: inorganic phosphate transporter [Bacteroidales bacterium]|nr:inorganic phosphate transporter [Bacteroidales bacterium]